MREGITAHDVKPVMANAMKARMFIVSFSTILHLGADRFAQFGYRSKWAHRGAQLRNKSVFIRSHIVNSFKRNTANFRAKDERVRSSSRKNVHVVEVIEEGKDHRQNAA